MNVLKFKMNDARALKLLRDISADSINVKFTDHALKQMRKRKITALQVINCLQKGQVSEPVHLDIHGLWKLTVTRTSAGECITVAVSIDSPDAIVITAF